MELSAKLVEQDDDVIPAEGLVADHTDCREAASTNTPRLRKASGAWTRAFGNRAAGPGYQNVSVRRSGLFVQDGALSPRWWATSAAPAATSAST